MSRKRDRITIIYDILKSIQDKPGEVKPTHILYRSNLSSQMLKEYLDELISKRFIEEKKDRKGRKSFVLLEKGHKYIQDFAVIKSFIDSYGLDEEQ